MGIVSSSPSPSSRFGTEGALPGTNGRQPLPSGFTRNPYRGVLLALLLAALLGAVVAAVGGYMLLNPVLLDIAVTLGLATGILLGTVVAQTIRERPSRSDEKASSVESIAKPEIPAISEGTPKPEETQKYDAAKISPRLTAARAWVLSRMKNLDLIEAIRVGAAGAGVAGILFVIRPVLPELPPPIIVAGIAVALCLGAAGVAAMAARYFATIDGDRLPEGPWLSRGARMVAWILVLGAISVGLEWAVLTGILQVVHFAVLAVDAAVCYGLLTAKNPKLEGAATFPADLDIFSALGSRPNILGSILDSAERQFGIDLRSTWALTVVRQTLEPLIIGLFLLGWLSTSLTVVGVEEQGLVERLGVPVGGKVLQPGLHLHWPWPVDQVFRIPVQRVQAAQVGHEGQEEEGPENVLWAVEHAPNEYTLVLGNGRDLITVDAAVQYRITDARAWRYNSQNPSDALRAIAYRAVMRSTVNRTLSDALSQNVATLTGQMRAMVQQDANALGLGVEIVGFTVGGMHPPVPVAPDYEAVVSAEISKVTMVVEAQAYRNEKVPAAEASAIMYENIARAKGADSLALAAGGAWSFRTLESQYRSSPEEYFFRRRLEALEKGLAGKHFTVVDSRFQRDGGELWLTQ
jgi:regulator of protease activity HflC (stomatin/prohibitin superfamily)